ncbi:hypothetical protein [Xenophilus azovorans]|uniref:hypothetical protein n=1 Tax=Xenophilus azovorans TaxID=151755 RepID=UPI0012ED590C|nr:hypothetical protein [Xenophilus azovorans]
MANQNILDLVQQRAESLVAENLRSSSIAISRLRELIAEANRLGHSHSAIHARLQAGGLRTSWNNYRVSLVRARKTATGIADRGAGTAAPPKPVSTAEVINPVGQNAFVAAAPPLSPTRVLDALAGAKQVASRDYAQVARDLHRKTRK